MELISSLSTSQKENMESDFEENMFFRFNHKYPGYEFVCLEKLKICMLPMLFYRDHIPDLEQFNSNGKDVEVDDATIYIRNVYATKMLLLFYPFQENHDFLLFEDRWIFFCDANERRSMYCYSTRIMQNIQDVENSKKIVSSEFLSSDDSEIDVEQVLQIVWQ
jgi:hypothetical protein